MKDLDVRGMSCPLPVVAVKKALEEGVAGLRVLLDDGAPRENVRRFVENRGYTVSEAAFEQGFALTVAGSAQAPAEEKAPRSGATVMLIGSDRMGEGSEELGKLLMKNFIMTLKDVPQLPDRIFFVNSGVHLTTEGSEVLEALEALGNQGVEVFSCGLCLDYFGKKEKLSAGAVTNMYTIAESMTAAGLVLRV